MHSFKIDKKKKEKIIQILCKFFCEYGNGEDGVLESEYSRETFDMLYQIINILEIEYDVDWYFDWLRIKLIENNTELIDIINHYVNVKKSVYKFIKETNKQFNIDDIDDIDDLINHFVSLKDTNKTKWKLFTDNLFMVIPDEIVIEFCFKTGLLKTKFKAKA